MKKLTLILFALWINLGYCQDITGNTSEAKIHTIASKPPFYLGHYLIDPVHKTVGVQMIGGEGKVGETVSFPADTAIHYERTSLIILGEQILFKEHFPFHCNFNNLQVIASNKYGTIFRDSNYVYYYNTYNGVSGSKVDISAYKALSNGLYEDKQGVFFTLDDMALKKITPVEKIYTGNLKHLVNQFFTDKNGLYRLDSHFDRESDSVVYQFVKLEDSNGKKILPSVNKYYLIYGKQIYGTTRYGVEKLPLDADKIREMEWGDNYQILTDGKNLVEIDGNGMRINDRNFTNDFFSKNHIDIQQIMPADVNFIAQKDTDILYLPLGTSKYIHGSEVYKPGLLLKTSDGFYFLPRWMHTTQPQKLKNVLVYNIDTRREEAFDITKFKSINGTMFAYGNHLFYDYLPVKEPVSIKKLTLLTKGLNKTRYITDGKQLIYIGSSYGYTIGSETGQEYVVLKKAIIFPDNISDLQVVNENVLADDNYIYSYNSVIPKTALGFPIEMCIGIDY